MWVRLAAAAAIYLALCGLMGMLLIWLLTSPGSAWDPNEAALLREIRVITAALGYYRQRPFALCGLAEIVALPVVFALWVHGPKGTRGVPSAGRAAGRAALLALAAYGLFLGAIVVTLALVPFRMTIMGSWSLTFYEFLVLAYTVAFIPTATLGFAIVRGLGFVVQAPPPPLSQ